MTNMSIFSEPSEGFVISISINSVFRSVDCCSHVWPAIYIYWQTKTGRCAGLCLGAVLCIRVHFAFQPRFIPVSLVRLIDGESEWKLTHMFNVLTPLPAASACINDSGNGNMVARTNRGTHKSTTEHEILVRSRKCYRSNR
jgi:hypothetical protein